MSARSGTVSRRVLSTRPQLDALAAKLNIKKPEDWYKVSSKSISDAGGASLMRSFRGSVRAAVLNAYPEHKWLPWKFGKLNNGFWASLENQRMFFEYAKEQMKIKKDEDWYLVTSTQLRKLGGDPLLRKRYDSSISRALKAIYPHHDWCPWKFKRAAKGFWQVEDNQRQFFEYLTKDIKGWKSKEQWYQITRDDVISAGGAYLLRHFYNGNHHDAFKHLYPDHQWNPWKFIREQTK